MDAKVDDALCKICKRKLNNPSDPTTRDCGGDCLRCMAECGDPDCIKEMNRIKANRRDTIEKDEHLTQAQKDAFYAFTWQMIKDALFSPLERHIRSINEKQTDLPNEPEHYHAYFHGKEGLIILCLNHQGEDEAACAKYVAGIILNAELPYIDLIHVGGGKPAFHSSHVKAEDSLPFGSSFHDRSKLN